MDLLTALKILLRQWPVVLAGLALTVVGVFQVGTMVDPSYEAKDTVLLLSPGANANPYLDFGPNLEVAADALMVVVQSPEATDLLEAAGATGSFGLERETGPLIDVTATAGSEEDATRTVELVVTQLRSELESAQAEAPADQRITLDELTAPVPEAKYGSRIRAQAAAVALGLVGTVAAALTVDAVRRQRREAQAQAEARAQAEAPADRERERGRGRGEGPDDGRPPRYPQVVPTPAARRAGAGPYGWPDRDAGPAPARRSAPVRR